MAPNQPRHSSDRSVGIRSVTNSEPAINAKERPADKRKRRDPKPRQK